MESINKWDIAAGDAILRAAGGQLLNSELKNYKYNFPSNLTGTFYKLSHLKKNGIAYYQKLFNYY